MYIGFVKEQKSSWGYFEGALTYVYVNARESILFDSPDPFVQDGSNTQSYNRYSYCWNNPLKYSDPSGYANDLSWSEVQARNYAWGASYTNVEGQWFSSHWLANQTDEFRKNLFFAIDKKNKGELIAIEQFEKGYSITFGVPYGQGTTKRSYGYLNREEAVLLQDFLNDGVPVQKYNPFRGKSHVLETSYDNNEGNFWRDHNLIPHEPQPQLFIIGTAYPTHFEINFSFTTATPFTGFTIGVSYIRTPEKQGFFFESGFANGLSFGPSLSFNDYSPEFNEKGPTYDDFIGWQETYSAACFLGVNSINSLNSMQGDGSGELYHGKGISLGSGFGVSYSRTKSISIWEF